jgi:hypothetical protein
VLEPRGTLAYGSVFNLGQVGAMQNLSPYAVSPLLWAGLVASGTVAALVLARTRYGWPAAVALSVLATPRLLSYQLMTLVAALVEPLESRERPGWVGRAARALRSGSGAEPAR